jgi:hypothetical protein
MTTQLHPLLAPRTWRKKTAYPMYCLHANRPCGSHLGAGLPTSPKPPTERSPLLALQFSIFHFAFFILHSLFKAWRKKPAYPKYCLHANRPCGSHLAGSWRGAGRVLARSCQRVGSMLAWGWQGASRTSSRRTSMLRTDFRRRVADPATKLPDSCQPTANCSPTQSADSKYCLHANRPFGSDGLCSPLTKGRTEPWIVVIG